jgi:hypothetical protein
MAYIGTKPADKPLTSADITDSIITSAKIADGTIVNADINASAAIASTKLSGVTSPAAFRNIVINGDMQIAQRGTSTASVSSGSGFDCVDRFSRYISTAGTWTISQSTDVPSGYGFAKSLKFDCTTANASLSAGSEFSFSTQFEGQNLQYLKKGTANAQSLTLSFWVKSTKTGTFIVNINDNDNARVVSKSYTVSVSNTWEFKTLTFPADTSGAFDNDNAASVQLRFWLVAGTTFTSGTLNAVWGSQSSANYAVGQVNCADSTSNDFLITGVQLEAGTSATDFEFLPYDVSLGRCQRYFEKFKKEDSETVICISQGVGSTEVFGRLHFITEKRVVPSGSISAAGDFQVLTGSAGAWSTATSGSCTGQDLKNARLQLAGLSGMTTGGCHEVRINGASGTVFLNSEF